MRRFVPREEWGAGPRTATRSSHPIHSPVGITCHWEGPHLGPFGHSDCARKIKAIQAGHKAKGWADIAYNLVACPHGYVFEGRGAYVRSAANGTIEGNDDWYAVCYLGGQGDPFTDPGKAGMRYGINWLRRRGAGMKVNGHRDHKPTECPGAVIYTWVRAGVRYPVWWVVTDLRAMRRKARKPSVKDLISSWIRQANERSLP